MLLIAADLFELKSFTGNIGKTVVQQGRAYLYKLLN